jgi:ABC-2 type transport system permease protein
MGAEEDARQTAIAPGGGAGGGPMTGGGALQAARLQSIALLGIVERNAYLVKRYGWWELAFFVWTIANTLTVVFIADGVQAGGGTLDVERQTTILLIGAVIWSYLGIVFEVLTETVAWERWEGTIEYTFMAPLSRAVHLLGMGAFAVLYGVIRTALLFAVVALFFGLAFPDANWAAALLLLATASVSFVGVGMITAVLPLISPEKGAQLGFVAQGMLLVVSGVYYPVDVMPQWMQWISTVSPATYALEGIRGAVLDGHGVTAHDLIPLIAIGALSIPLGLATFRVGERYAKRTGKLKRAG